MDKVFHDRGDEVNTGTVTSELHSLLSLLPCQCALLSISGPFRPGARDFVSFTSALRLHKSFMCSKGVAGSIVYASMPGASDDGDQHFVPSRFRLFVCLSISPSFPLLRMDGFSMIHSLRARLIDHYLFKLPWMHNLNRRSRTRRHVTR